MKNHNLYILKIFLLFFIVLLAGCGEHCLEPTYTIDLTIEVDALACARENLTTTYQIICYNNNEFLNQIYSIESQSTRDILIFHENSFTYQNEIYCILETENQAEYREDVNIPTDLTCHEHVPRNISFILDFQACYND